jgi:uncharacterized protein (TIGR00369 family)
MQELTELFANARRRGDTQSIIDFVPYARLLGIEVAEAAGAQLTFRLPFRRENIGNARLPALHGGVIGAFMEHSALLQILWSMETDFLPKVIDFSIDYLRPGRPETIFASCEVLRQGQRVANVAIRAWQGEPERTVATARSHFLLSRPDADVATMPV